MFTSQPTMHTFIGEVDGQPGHGYAGYIKGECYPLQILYFGDDTVEITCAQLGLQGLLLSAGLFKRWWQPA